MQHLDVGLEKVYVIIRKISPYTAADVQLGIFRSLEKAH